MSVKACEIMFESKGGAIKQQRENYPVEGCVNDERRGFE